MSGEQVSCIFLREYGPIVAEFKQNKKGLSKTGQPLSCKPVKGTLTMRIPPD